MLLSPYGYESGRYAIRNLDKDIKQKIQVKSPVIIDGGTNKGDLTYKFLRMYHNKCTVHCFEPIPELAKALEDKFKKFDQVTIHNKALGDENKNISFYVTNFNPASSVLKPAEPSYTIKQTIDVDQVRLDEILNSEIDILKLDLQGYEIQALIGCEKLLPQTKLILTEVEFDTLYENQPLFGEVDTFLREKGFKLFNLYDIYTDENGQLSSADALYLNKEYF